MNKLTISFSILFFIINNSFTYATSPVNDKEHIKNYITDYKPTNKDGSINVVVEITAGTNEKWEVSKPDGKLKLNYKKGKPRIIKYLGYPGNYGMIPGTLLSKLTGGDGDPLDVITIGSPIKRGEVVKGKVIGVLKFNDKGEKDDKLLAVIPRTAFYEVDNITQLDESFPGVTLIIKNWFLYYKGSGKMVFKGFGSEEEAKKILNAAINEYQEQKLEDLKPSNKY